MLLILQLDASHGLKGDRPTVDDSDKVLCGDL